MRKFLKYLVWFIGEYLFPALLVVIFAVLIGTAIYFALFAP